MRKELTRAGGKADRAKRVRCLLVPLHGDHGLARPLLEHISLEIPGIDFTLDERQAVDCIWAFGWEPRARSIVEWLRRRHPRAQILVTNSCSEPGWRAQASTAGADLALSWPQPWGELGRLLRGQCAQTVPVPVR